MAYIYKITNLVNGKIYIGKTSYNIEIRFQGHISDSKKDNCKNRPLYRAMNKYGIDNFIVEAIEECTEEKASEREAYWIQKLNSYYEGYNATLGGEGKPLYSKTEIISLIKEGKATKEISEIIGCCKDTVRDIAKQANISITKDLSPLAQKMEESKCRVLQIDKNTNEQIQFFNSYADAARWLVANNYVRSGVESGVRSHIGEVCKGKRKTAYGFKWQKV